MYGHLSLYLTLWISELFQKLGQEQLISWPALVRMILDEVVQDGLDLLDLQIVIVVAYVLLTDLEKREDLLCFFGF